MVYITGPNDTLKTVKQRDTPLGSLEVYEKTCKMMNPEMCEKNPNWKQKLPPYTPIFLLFEEPVDNETRKEIWYELSKFSQEERQILYELQEQGSDLATQVAVGSLMEEFQEYAKGVRQWLKTPLVLTPWKHANEIATNKHIFKAIGEGSSHISMSIRASSLYRNLDELFENMLARDELNRTLHMLEGKREHAGLRKSLEQQIKDLTKKIKQQLPKRLDNYMNKYLRNRMTADGVRKMRANCYSVKAGRSGKFLTTNLQVLDRTGLGRLRSLAGGLKQLSKGISQGAKMLNYGIVAYDTYEAYNNGGSVARTFITGGLAVYLSTQAVAAVGGTTALGGFVIGSGVTVSNLMLGSTILLSCPVVGWTALIVGLAAAAVISYGIKKGVEGVWDLGEDLSPEVYKQASEATKEMRQVLQSAWTEKSDWLLEFYGNDGTQGLRKLD